jgi:hypothetical protein
MHNKTYRQVAKCALVSGLMLLGVAGCSRGAADSSAPHSGFSAISSAAPSTISAAEAAPKPGAPAWCGMLDNPEVTALANVLPQLVTSQAAAAAAKVHAAAAVLRHAAASAPAGPGQLLAAAAGSLDTAADAKSAASLQTVGAAFSLLSKGVQGTCGFH